MHRGNIYRVHCAFSAEINWETVKNLNFLLIETNIVRRPKSKTKTIRREIEEVTRQVGLFQNEMN